MAGLHIRKFGNWDEFIRLSLNLRRHIDEAAYLSLKRWGIRAKEIVIAHLDNQDLPWAPLSTSYVAWKQSAGYSLDTLIMSGEYKKSITKILQPGDSVVYVGVRDGVVYRNKHSRGVPIATIARLHEYGSTSRNIAARPLWEPSGKEAMRWHVAKNTPEKILNEILRKNYRGISYNFTP